MRNDILDVAVVGYGPTAQMIAALLGQRGHRVTAFERHLSLYPLPRASGLDHELARALQAMGVMDRYLAISAEPASKYHWINGQGRHLMTIDWGRPEADGYFNMYIGFQPRLEDCLSEAAEATGNVDVHRGWDVVGIRHRPDGLVSVEAAEHVRSESGEREATGARREVTARYVIAADGGNSYVRRALGIGLEDWGFRSEWLVVDGKIKRPLGSRAKVLGDRTVRFDNELIQVCDPERPMFFGPLGKGGRRFEFALMPGETIDDMERPERAWELLGEHWGVTPDDLEIYRCLVYGFNSFMAKDWRQGNVFLVGDAAHAMPPYLGQGLNSGMRDAVNLAWKLDLVLRGLAPDGLLDTYQVERAANARYYIEASLAVGAVSCTFDHEAAAERDAAFFEGRAQPPAEPPGLTGGLLLKDEPGAATRPAGLLGPQAEVTYRGRTGRLDDLTAPFSFAVLAYGFDPRCVLDPGQVGYLSALGAELVRIEASDDLDGEAVLDVTGSYADYFRSWALSALVVRPDFYVYGGAAKPGDLAGVVAALIADLPIATAPRAEPLRAAKTSAAA